MLGQSVIDMYQPKKRTIIESVTHNATVDMSFELFGMPSIRNPRERQKRLNTHVAFAQNTFVNKSQEANVPPKRQRREIIFQESHLTRDTEIADEVALERFDFSQRAVTGMKDRFMMVFNLTPDVCFELRHHVHAGI